MTDKIVMSAEGDGAFAVADVDTPWRIKEVKKGFHWKGRATQKYLPGTQHLEA